MQARSLDMMPLLFAVISEHRKAQDGPCKNFQPLDMPENLNITEVSATEIFTK